MRATIRRRDSGHGLGFTLGSFRLRAMLRGQGVVYASCVVYLLSLWLALVLVDGTCMALALGRGPLSTLYSPVALMLKLEYG